MPAAHPLRLILSLVDAVLAGLPGKLQRLQAAIGRHLIPPEKLLWALLLQAFPSVRS